tara:strand:- start:39 stop:296 length:258 start_codon:yes stop_codon:yes gene_type:complete
MPQNLVDRLTSQLSAKGVKNAKGEAISILKARGHLHADGTLTAEGKKRQDMGPDGRAKDRASKVSGRPASDYKYNPKTNLATLKK